MHVLRGGERLPGGGTGSRLLAAHPHQGVKKVVEMPATEAVKYIRTLDDRNILGYIRDVERMRKSVRKTVLPAVEDQLGEWQDVAI